MFNKDFYPTPDRVIGKMVKGVDFRAIKTVLEPSAGRGNICDYVFNKLHNYQYSNYNKVDFKTHIDTIEIEPELQHILKGKGYKVISSDFLKYEGYKVYDLVIANVPFSQGDKHVLKIINMVEQGLIKQVRCLCNAETLKNAYSNDRKILLQKLQELNAQVEYIQDAFNDEDVERKTNVEIALISIDAEVTEKSDILKNLQKEETVNYVTEEETQSEVGEQIEPIKAICDQFKREVTASVRLIKEVFATSKICLKSFDDKVDSILTLNVCGRVYKDVNSCINETLKEIRLKYWKTFLQSDSIKSLMTSNIREEWNKKLEELKEYDFTLFNVTQVQCDIKMSLSKGIEDTILNLFDEFTRYAMNDGSKNIHYYNGWKTNKAHCIDKKVILPYVEVYCPYGGHLQDYKVIDKLRDIEKVFTYIDSGALQMEHIDLQNTIKMNFKYNNTKNIELKYFKIDCYKKNTIHLKFDEKYIDVLKRFNYIAGSLKGWLPPTYGNTDYNNMSEQDKSIINSYCGKDEYIKNVQTNKSLYKFDINNMLLGCEM